MPLNNKDKWDVLNGLLGAAFAGLSVIASVFIYLHGHQAAIQQEHELLTVRNRIEYDRNLWNELRATYKELAQTLGRMAAELDETGHVSTETRREFNATYWGTVILVEGDGVQLELVRLRNDLRDLENGRILPDKIKLRVARIVTLSKREILRITDVETD